MVIPSSSANLRLRRATPGQALRRSLGGTTAGPGTTAVTIPAITFSPGGLYQLWLVALNSKGKSLPGPIQNWTAV